MNPMPTPVCASPPSAARRSPSRIGATDRRPSRRRSPTEAAPSGPEGGPGRGPPRPGPALTPGTEPAASASAVFVGARRMPRFARHQHLAYARPVSAASTASSAHARRRNARPSMARASCGYGQPPPDRGRSGDRGVLDRERLDTHSTARSPRPPRAADKPWPVEPILSRSASIRSARLHVRDPHYPRVCRCAPGPAPRCSVERVETIPSQRVDGLDAPPMPVYVLISWSHSVQRLRWPSARHSRRMVDHRP